MFFAILAASLFAAPPKYVVPEGEAEAAATLWKTEYDKQLPQTKADVKEFRNATGKSGFAAKEQAEKTLKRMGAEPFYVMALRIHGIDAKKGKTGCLESSTVKVIAAHEDGWIGEVRVRGGGSTTTGFGGFGAGSVEKKFLFVSPFPGNAKIGKTVELTGFFYSPGAAHLTVLIPVEIDPENRPVPPNK